MGNDNRELHVRVRNHKPTKRHRHLRDAIKNKLLPQKQYQPLSKLLEN